MADLGNLFFSLGLDTKQIDAAWDKALKKYGQKAQVDLKLNTGDLKTIKAQYAELNAKNKLAQDTEQRGKMNALKLTREQLKTEELINTQKARTASVQDRSTAAIHRTNSALSTQNRLMQNLNTMAASYISIFAAGRLLSNLVQISGEFETQKVSLQAILRDLDGANAIFDQIKKLAVKSPFQFKDLISYTKQLSAFSIPMNELFDTTKMLADVSAGLGVGMDRLVLAYGQIRAASVLRGQEVRQLTEAGIPVIEALRKKFEELGETGITTADVFDKISARLVPFSMIKDMFTEMTSEGGMFFKMQEIKAETLQGKISNLTDAYQIMFAEIGEKGDAVLKGSVDAVRYLMSNYEAVGKIIATLIATYGVYQTSLIVTAVANNALVISNGLLGASFIAVQRALTTLTAAMAANPYVALALGITTVVGAMWALSDSSTAAEKAQKKLEFTMAGLGATKAKMSKDVGGLVDTITGETSSVYAQVKAWDELIKRYVFFSQYSIDDLRKMSAEQKASLISSFTQKEGSAQVRQLYNDKLKQIKELESKVSGLTSGAMGFTKDTFGVDLVFGAGDKLAQQYAKDLAIAKAEAKGLATELGEIARIEKDAEFQSKSEAERKRLLTLRKDNLEIQKADVEANTQEGKAKDVLLKSLNKQITDTNTAIAKFREGEVRQNKDFWEEQKSNAESVIDGFEAGTLKLMRAGSFAGIKPETVGAYKKAVSDIAQANKMLGIYDFGDKNNEKNAKKAERASERLTEIKSKEYIQQLRLEADVLQAQEKSTKIRLALAQNEFKQKIALLDEERRKKLQLITESGGDGGELVGVDLIEDVSSRKLAEKEYKASVVEINRDAAQEIKDIWQDVVDFNLKGYEKEIAALNKKFDEESRRLKLLLTDEKELQNKILLLANVRGKKESDIKLKYSIQSLETQLEMEYAVIEATTIGLSREAKIEEKNYKAWDFNMRKKADLLRLSFNEQDQQQVALIEAQRESARIAREENEKDMRMASRNIDTMGSILNDVLSLSSSNFAKQIGATIGEATSAIGSLSKRKDKDTFGKVTDLASLFIALIKAVFSLKSAMKDAIAELDKSKADLQTEQIGITQKINSIQNAKIRTPEDGNIFIKDYAKEAAAAALALADAQQKLNDAIAQAGAYGTNAWEMIDFKFNAEKGVIEYLGNIRTALDKLKVQTGVTSKTFKFLFLDIITGSEPVYDSLLKTYPDLVDEAGNLNIELAKTILNMENLPDYTKKALEGIVEYQEEINAANEAMESAITSIAGSISGDLYSALRDAWEGGTDSFTAFKNSVSDGLREIVSQMVFNAVFGEAFTTLQENLKKSFGIGGDKDVTDDIASLLASAPSLLAAWEKAMATSESAAREAGMDWRTGNAATTLGGSIQAAQLTENTGNLIGSYINAIRADGSKRTMIAEKMLPIMSNINDTMGNGLAHLAAISSNTMRSAVGIEHLVEKVDALTSPNGATRLNAVIKTS